MRLQGSVVVRSVVCFERFCECPRGLRFAAVVPIYASPQRGLLPSIRSSYRILHRHLQEVLAHEVRDEVEALEKINRQTNEVKGVDRV